MRLLLSRCARSSCEEYKAPPARALYLRSLARKMWAEPATCAQNRPHPPKLISAVAFTDLGGLTLFLWHLHVGTSTWAPARGRLHVGASTCAPRILQRHVVIRYQYGTSGPAPRRSFAAKRNFLRFWLASTLIDLSRFPTALWVSIFRIALLGLRLWAGNALWGGC